MNNLLKKIVEDLQYYLEDNLISIALFGSRARGKAQKESDYDLFIISRNLPPERLKRLRFLHYPKITAKEGISVIGKEPEEF